MSLSTKTLLRAAAYAEQPRAGGGGGLMASSRPGLKGRVGKSNKVGADGRTNEARVVVVA